MTIPVTTLCLQACPDQRTAPFRLASKPPFGHYGLPEAMLMDNGSPLGITFEQPWIPLSVRSVDLGIE